MKPMTHGEIRGTLILLAIMAAILAATYISRGGADTDGTQSSPTLHQIDSIRLEEAASRQAAPPSTLPTTHPTDSTTSTSSRPRKRTTTPLRVNRPTHTPAPSPLDRPV